MGLQVWLPLNGSLINNGLSDLTFSTVSSNTFINEAGKIGKCYENNSYTAGGLVSNKMINLGQHQSMFCWVKFNSLNSSSSLGGALVSAHRHNNKTGMGITIKYVSATTGYLSVNTGTGSARTYNKYCGTTLLQANTWYHVGYTYNGSTIKLYVNGVCETTQGFTGMSVPADYLMVFCWSFAETTGSTPHDHYKLNGCINDVRVYNHTLSDKEVRELARGLVLHYKFNDSIRHNISTTTGSKTVTIGSSATSAYTGYWYIDTAMQDYLTEGSYITVAYDYDVDMSTITATTSYIYAQLNGSRLSPSQSITYSMFPKGRKIESFKVTADQAAYANQFRVRFRLISSNAGAKFTISNVQIYLGIQAPNVIYDSSGYNNDGTLLFDTPVYTNNTPRYDYAISFIDKKVMMRSPLGNLGNFNFAGNYTITGWVQNVNSGATHQTFLGLMPFSTNYDKKFGFNFQNSAIGILNGSSDIGLSTNGNYNNGDWIFVALVNTGTNYQIYINAELYTSGTQSISVNDNTLAFCIGIRPIGYTGSASSYTLTFPDNVLAENFSDVRLYMTSLTVDDLQRLYNTAASMDNGNNVYTREYVENDNLKLTKTGLFQNSNIYDNDELTKISILNTEKQIQGFSLYEY